MPKAHSSAVIGVDGRAVQTRSIGTHLPLISAKKSGEASKSRQHASGFGQLTAYGGSMTIAQNWYSAPEPKAPRDAVAKNRGAGAATLAAHTRRNF